MMRKVPNFAWMVIIMVGAIATLRLLREWGLGNNVFLGGAVTALFLVGIFRLGMRRG